MTVHQDTTGHGVNQPPPSDNAQWLRRDDHAAKLGERLRHADAPPPEEAGASTHSRSLGFMPTRALLVNLSDPAQRQFGDYELTALLGQGGMGVVYRAHQTRLDRDVALKLLVAGPWAPPDFVERLRHEAHHAARLAHPNIVSVFDVDDHDGIVFYTMRLIEGPSLRERLAHTGPMPAAHAVRLVQRIAEALDYAHRIGVLHLDIKPSNILLDEQGEPHLADFGLARHTLPDPADEGHDASGTPYYMAPEQAEPGLHPLCAATDIRGLGATFFEMLAGRVPIAGATPRETLHRIVEETAPRLRRVQPGADRDLDAICARCLARNPQQRYASAAALADDLRRWQTRRPVRARGNGVLYRFSRFAARNRNAVALVGLIALSLIGGATGVIWQQERARREAEQALAMRDYAIDMLRQSAPGQAVTDDLLASGADNLALLPQGSVARLDLLTALLQRHDDLGLHLAGRELARRELGDAPTLGTAPSASRLQALVAWAQMHAATGERARALAALEAAVASVALAGTPAHTRAMNLLGQLHAEARHFDQAERWHRRALEQHAPHVPPDDPELARMRSLLAAALAAQRRDADALALAEQAASGIAPEDSPLRAQVLHHAGLHRTLAGDAPGAHALFEESRLLQRVLEDTGHLGERAALHAANALDLGEPERAHALLDQASDALRASARRRSRELADLTRMRGELWLASGDANLAAAAFDEAVDLYRESASLHDTSTPEIAYAGALLAIARVHAQRLPEARTALDRTDPAADADMPPATHALRLAATALLARASGEAHAAQQDFAHAIATLAPTPTAPVPLAFRLREARDLQRIRAWRDAQPDAMQDAGHER